MEHNPNKEAPPTQQQCPMCLRKGVELIRSQTGFYRPVCNACRERMGNCLKCGAKVHDCCC